MASSYKEEHVPGFVKLFSRLGRNSVSEAIGIVHAVEEIDHAGFYLWLMQSVDKAMSPDNFLCWIDPGQVPGDVRMVIRPVWWGIVPSPMLTIHSRELNGTIGVYCHDGQQQDRRQTRPLFYEAFTDAVRLFNKSMKQHIDHYGDVTQTVNNIRALDKFIHTLHLIQEN